MSAAVDSGHGVTITFGTSAFTNQIISLDWSGISRTAIETTYMGTTAAGAGAIANRTFIPSKKVNAGILTVVVNFNPDDDPPMQGDEAVETITVQFPASGGDAAGASWAANGCMTDFSVAVPEDDRMTATMTIQLSDSITITDGA